MIDINNILAMKPVVSKDYTQLMNNNDWIAEVKYDGERYLCTILNILRFTSLHKSSKDDLYVNKTENFPHLKSLKHNLKYTIIDGEILSKTLEDTCAITGSLPERAIKLQKEIGYVNYRVFDCLVLKGEDIRHKPYHFRRRVAKIIVEELNSEYVKLSLASRSNKQELLDNVYKKEGEGIVLKYINSSYYAGKKHKEWFKVKKEIKVDAVIMDYELGKGKYNKELVGAIVYGAYNKDGILEKWGTVGSMTKDVIELLTNNKKKYIGKVIEIECQGYTKAGNLRHPRFKRIRNDKLAIECLKERQI